MTAGRTCRAGCETRTCLSGRCDAVWQPTWQLLSDWPAVALLACRVAVQVSTLCVREGLLVAGGFSGELVLADMQHTEQGPAWDDEEGEEQQQQEQGVGSLLSSGPSQHEQQQEEVSMDVIVDSVELEGQQQQQQALLIRQQVLRAANQLYPGAQLQDWQPYQQQWASLLQPQQAASSLWQEHDQGQPRQQHMHASAAPPWPSQSLGTWPLNQQQHNKPHAGAMLQAAQQQRHGQAPEPLMGAAGPSAARVLHCCRVTQSENGITNGIEIFDSCEHPCPRLHCSALLQCVEVHASCCHHSNRALLQCVVWT